MIYKIFGKNIEIQVENREIEDILQKELALYLDADNVSIDIKINIVNRLKLDGVYSNTPSIHTTFENGFVANFAGNRVFYKKGKSLTIDVEIKRAKNYLKKFISIGYRDNIESIGQILHELVLVPLNFFFANRAIIHASSMKSQDSKTLMIGGTGGVGKTSLELLLCGELGYSFISDDIAVVAESGELFPNLSYPKIYAYNVVDNDKLEKALFEKSDLLDKFQWKFIKKFRGDSRVRRAISPTKIFNSVEQSSNKIDEYYILFKTNSVEKIVIESISFEKASELTLEIIKNEYHSVTQHIVWHEYNSKLMNFEPIIELKETYQNWINIYKKLFKNIQCSVVKIPVNISHEEFLIQMRDKFSR